MNCVVRDRNRGRSAVADDVSAMRPLALLDAAAAVEERGHWTLSFRKLLSVVWHCFNASPNNDDGIKGDSVHIAHRWFAWRLSVCRADVARSS